MNFVAPAGPPWVREYTRGYVLIIDTVDKTSTRRLVGFRRGSVINLNCCHAPAPSILAASYYVSEIALIPDTNITM